MVSEIENVAWLAGPIEAEHDRVPDHDHDRGTFDRLKHKRINRSRLCFSYLVHHDRDLSVILIDCFVAECQPNLPLHCLDSDYCRIDLNQ
jgi:hypothetical protein